MTERYKMTLLNVEIAYTAVSIVLSVLSIVFAIIQSFKTDIYMWSLSFLIVYIFIHTYSYIGNSWNVHDVYFFKDSMERMLMSKHKFLIIIWEQITSICGFLIIFGSIIFIFGFVPDLSPSITLKFIIVCVLNLDMICLYGVGCHYYTIKSFIYLKRNDLHRFSYEELYERMQNGDLDE